MRPLLTVMPQAEVQPVSDFDRWQREYDEARWEVRFHSLSRGEMYVSVVRNLSDDYVGTSSYEWKIRRLIRKAQRICDRRNKALDKAQALELTLAQEKP